MRRCRDLRAGLLAGLLAVVLAAGGCATVPTSGPVERHTPQAAGADSGVRIDALPPADGASRQLVVEGFLHAMSVYQPDYHVAREYLTEAASRDWRPESGVQIYADGYPPTEYEQTVALAAPLSGRLDGTGRYSPAAGESGSGGSGTVPANFTLVQDDEGQWRISNPPDGLLVSRYVFATGFVPVNLHFLDTTGTVLVPDRRFFAAGDQAAEFALRAQLAGPSAWLAPSVRASDTDGVEVDDVELGDDGTVDVELGGTADQLPLDQQRTLLAELAFTLAGFGGVSAVRVAAAGTPWRTESGQVLVRPASFAQLSPTGAMPRTLFVVRDGKVQRLADAAVWSDFTEVEVPVARPGQLAVNDDLTSFAVTDGTRLQLAEAGAEKATTVRSADDLLPPFFSRGGELWSAVGAGLARLQVFDGDRRLEVAVEASEQYPQPAQVPLVALALSPDGARLAAIFRRGRSTQVALARVERGEGSVMIGGWRTLDVAATTGATGRALDLGWFSATELLVLQSGDDGNSSVVRLSEDGATATDIGPNESDNLTRLAVSPGRAVALGADGGLYRFDSEFSWNLAIRAVDAAAWSG